MAILSGDRITSLINIIIEKIQRRATKYLAGLQDTPYSERLCILGLPSLQFR